MSVVIRKETNLYDTDAIADGISGAISTYDASQDQTAIFNKLTDNGTAEGIFIQGGQLYINMSYLQTGTLKLGGANNGNGLLVVYNASGTEIGRWDNTGLTATGDFHMSKSLMEFYIGSCLTMYIDYVAGNYYSYENCVAAVWRNSSNNVTGRRTWHNRGGCMQEVTMTTNTRAVNAHYFGISSSDMNMASPPSTSNPIKSGYNAWEEFSSSHFYVFCENNNTAALAWQLEITSSGGKINGNTITLASSSSERYKHNITTTISEELDAHRLYDLEMKQFVFNDDHSLQYGDMKGKTIPGFIAEDVDEIYPAATIHSDNGEVESWDERRIIPAMLKLIQEQHKEIEKLKSVIHIS